MKLVFELSTGGSYVIYDPETNALQTATDPNYPTSYSFLSYWYASTLRPTPYAAGYFISEDKATILTSITGSLSGSLFPAPLTEGDQVLQVKNGVAAMLNGATIYYVNLSTMLITGTAALTGDIGDTMSISAGKFAMYSDTVGPLTIPDLFTGSTSYATTPVCTTLPAGLTFSSYLYAPSVMYSEGLWGTILTNSGGNNAFYQYKNGGWVALDNTIITNRGPIALSSASNSTHIVNSDELYGSYAAPDNNPTIDIMYQNGVAKHTTTSLGPVISDDSWIVWFELLANGNMGIVATDANTLVDKPVLDSGMSSGLYLDAWFDDTPFSTGPAPAPLAPLFWNYNAYCTET
jgi:hypothetical protein